MRHIFASFGSASQGRVRYGLFALLLAACFARVAQGQTNLLHEPTYERCRSQGQPVVTRREIYRDGWIDLNKNGVKDVYEDATQPVASRVQDLLSRMTVEEKTAQCATLYGYRRYLQDHLPMEAWRTAIWKDGIANIDEHLNGYPYHTQTNLPGNDFLWPASRHTWALNEVQRFFIEDTRLGIPAEFTDEGIRGVEHLKSTCFPTQLGMGATWDRGLIRQMGEVTGREAYALGYCNVYAPILDILRDPRWGRCEETYGEDPFHASELGIEMVRGIQSQSVAATLKHFTVYSNNKGAREGRARVDPQCSPREMEMIHLWPFERVIRQANPLGVMSSLNDYDGVPVSASRHFLTDVLRQRMGFQGYVVSDTEAVEFLHQKHRVAASQKDAVRMAFLAGLNVRTQFAPPEEFILPLRELVAEGAIPLVVLDARVADVLGVKFREGLFDRPYRSLPRADEVVLAADHLEVARRASRECLVLLKNDGNFLPRDPSRIKRITVCGPNADSKSYALGHYGPGEVPVITVRAALEKRFAGKAKVYYALGADFFDERWPDTEIMWEPPTAGEQAGIDSAVRSARKSDLVIVVVGDRPRGLPHIRSTVGEDSSRTGLSLTGRQDDLIRAVAATGKPVVVVNISGRPVALNWANRLCPAIIQAFSPGMFGGEAIVDAIFGDYNPGGKISCSFPKTAGQVPLNFPTKPNANAERNWNDNLSVMDLLWPFGHGLSYTKFEYTNLRISPEQVATNQSIKVSFTVKNTGRQAGDEVPQLYVRDEISSVTAYEQMLRGFDRISLRPGESREVSFEIQPDHLALLDAEMRRVVEPGIFSVQVGSSSTDIRLKGKFEVLDGSSQGARPGAN